jgi:hypothetical protein
VVDKNGMEKYVAQSPPHGHYHVGYLFCSYPVGNYQQFKNRCI